MVVTAPPGVWGGLGANHPRQSPPLPPAGGDPQIGRGRPRSVMLTYRATTMTTPRPPRRTNHGAPYDLLIRGGEVLDPSQRLRGTRDVAFAWGRVAAVEPAGTIDPEAARAVIDA